jgi:hypothetical protein
LTVTVPSGGLNAPFDESSNVTVAEQPAQVPLVVQVEYLGW